MSATKSTTPETNQPEVSNSAEKIQEMQAKIVALEESLLQAKNDHHRALADYANLQRVTREERQRVVSAATAELIKQLLDPMDYLQTAAKHFEDKSIEMIRGQFLRVLEQEGLTKIDAEGKEFDPHTMEALEAVAGPKNKVMKERQAGYLLGAVLLRPAKVEVGNGEQ